MSNVTYYLVGFVAVLWIQVGYIFHKLRKAADEAKALKATVIELSTNILNKEGQILVLEDNVSELEAKAHNAAILRGNLFDRTTVLETRLDEIDKRTVDVKRAQDYVKSGHVFGWDPVASKFAWVKRKEEDGTPGVLHIKTDAFEEASNE